jgi:glucose-6-phosphate isomerase
MSTRRDHSARVTAAHAARSLTRVGTRGYMPPTMAKPRRRRGQEALTVRLDLNGAFAAASASSGTDAGGLEGLRPELERVRTLLASRRAEGGLPFAELPYRTADLKEIRTRAEEVRRDFDTMVVLGIGGAALGAEALTTALVDPRTPGVQVVVGDSIDPAAIQSLLASVDLRRTLFNVVSKSGDTAETTARFLIVRDRLMRELGAVDYKRHLLVTTEKERGSLRQIVNDEGFPSLAVPPDVDGRFAALTAMGLFPAAVAGIDVDEIVAGAASMDERSRQAGDALTDPPLMLAATLWHLAAHKGARIVVVMSYSERLAGLAEWFTQLWGGSLGRAVDRTGRLVEWGQTAIRARGSADQHSHLQLYLEGPRDKVVLFLRVEDHGDTLTVPAAYQDIEDVACLGGHSLGAVLNAEQAATEFALARHERPSLGVSLPAVTPFAVGQLVYLFELATVAAGYLADVDPFGQPAVEDAKTLTFALLGRPGLELQRGEVEGWIARKNPRFVV